MVNIAEALRHDKEKADLIRALHERQQRETDAVNKACIAELTQQIPENIYYSGQWLRGFLASFYKSDKDVDGRLTMDEFLENNRPTGHYQSEAEAKKASEDHQKVYDWIRSAMNSADINHDRKLTLGEFLVIGFLKQDRENNYSSAKKL